MAITRFPPQTIWLGGGHSNPVIENTLAVHEAVTPGMLVDRYVPSGTINRWRKAATADVYCSHYALEQSMLNRGVDDAYAAGDLAEVMAATPGTTIWALIASGANIAFGAKLGNAGNGLLKAVGGGVPCAIAIESVNNSAGPGTARIRIEVVA